MATISFEPMPDHIPADQRPHWLRRQLKAGHALEVQAMAGTVANAHTLAQFQRYVNGEVSLDHALAQARAQRYQHYQGYQQYVWRRHPRSGPGRA